MEQWCKVQRELVGSMAEYLPPHDWIQRFVALDREREVPQWEENEEWGGSRRGSTFLIQRKAIKMTEPLLARTDLYPFTTQRGSLTKNKNRINNSSLLIQRITNASLEWQWRTMGWRVVYIELSLLRETTFLWSCYLSWPVASSTYFS